MKIYMVNNIYECFGGENGLTIKGVFDSLEKANNLLNKLEKEQTEREFIIDEDEFISDYCISSFELNKEIE